MIYLTEKAAKKIKEHSPDKDLENLAIRFGAKGGACEGLEFSLSYENPIPKLSDNVFEQYGIKIFIDPKSFVYLDETTIDYVQTLMETGFKFINEKLTKRCGCNLSFSV